MTKAYYPDLTEQKQFWEVWNPSLRDPKALNDWSIKRGETILNLLHSLALDKPQILDLGCGTGWLTERLADFGSATGIDLAKTVIEEAKVRSPHVTFIAGNLFEAPLPANHFDVVVSQEVIAHVVDQAAYVKRAADLLKPGGYLIITTPNKFIIDRGNFPPQPQGHIEQWLTIGQLKRLLKSHFSVTRTMSILPMGHGGLLRLINSSKVAAILHLLISQRRLETFKERIGLGYTLIALAQKKP